MVKVINIFILKYLNEYNFIIIKRIFLIYYLKFVFFVPTICIIFIKKNIYISKKGVYYDIHYKRYIYYSYNWIDFLKIYED